MQWYHYVEGFLAGLFLANFVPHFVHGISGDPFPTPFAKPPGKGLSSPTLNVLWAFLNLVAGYFLARTARVFSGESVSLMVFFSGIVVISIFMSKRFADKEKQ
jgi:hypothetical protein